MKDTGKVLKLILKKTNHSWLWLTRWTAETFGCWEGSIDKAYKIHPQWITLLVINLAKELWRSIYIIKLGHFIIDIPDNEKVEWLLTNLKEK